MRIIKTSTLSAPITSVFAGVSLLGLAAAAPVSAEEAQPAARTQSAQGQNAGSVPIDVWALRDVVNAVDLSPDGKHLLVHISPSREGDYLLQVYKTSDLQTPYRTLNADPMEIINARWVSDNVIVGNAWEIKRETVRRQEDDTRNYATYFYDLKRNKFSQVDGNLEVVNELPNDPDTVLVAEADAVGDLGVDPFEAFRPRSYYKLNLRTGSQSLVLKGTRKYGNIVFDNDGNPRFAIGQDSDNTVKTYYRKPGDGSWTQFGEVYDQDDHENLWRFLTGFQGLASLDPDRTNIGYMIEARNGSDTASLWEFDFDTGQFGEELAAVEGADIMGVGTHSIPGKDTLAYAQYPGAKWERVWFDVGGEGAVRSARTADPAGAPDQYREPFIRRTHDGGHQ